MRYDELQSLDLPIGWSRRPSSLDADDGALSSGAIGLFGLLLTALAITLGAPFWFDLLNKIVVVRSTVKPREKSGVEASKDPRPPESPSATPAREPTSAHSTAPATDVAGARSFASITVPPPFHPQEWASGDDPDEGIL
jgi:hypothetical protein